VLPSSSGEKFVRRQATMHQGPAQYAFRPTTLLAHICIEDLANGDGYSRNAT
jgi:hypothetical protein